MRTRHTGLTALVAAVLVGCAPPKAPEPRDRFAGVARGDIQFVFGPWPNGMLLPAEERHKPHLALIELAASGEVRVRLPRGARGPAWCHVTAPGFEPLLLRGTVQEVGEQLRSGTFPFRPFPRRGVGIVTGVTYHGTERGAREADRACRELELGTVVAFTDAEDRKTKVPVDRQGVYRAELPAGRYKIGRAHR